MAGRTSIPTGESRDYVWRSHILLSSSRVDLRMANRNSLAVPTVSDVARSKTLYYPPGTNFEL